MKKLCIYIVSTILLAGVAFAEEPSILEIQPDTFTRVQPGVFHISVPGWFMTDEQEQTIRVQLLDGQYYHELSSILGKRVDAYKDLYDAETKVSNKYRSVWLEAEDRLVSVSAAASRNKVVYFLLGIGLAFGSAFAWGAVN